MLYRKTSPLRMRQDSRRRKQFRLLDCLEPRILFSAGASVAVTTQPAGNFTELVITGSTALDSIEVSQSGSTFTIVADGATQTISGTFGDMVIHAGPAGSTITVDASVTVNNMIYGGAGADFITDHAMAAYNAIVTIGGGVDAATGNGVSTDYWVDSTDIVNASAAEIAAGQVNTVSQFYQPWTADPTSPSYVPLDLLGQTLADPTDIGTPVNDPGSSLWGTGAAVTDVYQGSLNDCYVLASIQSLAYAAPSRLEQMAVDLGDGTYAVRFERGNVASYVRVSGDFSSSQAHVGPSGDVWPLVFESAYAFFRTGQNSYASLNQGFAGDVLADLGVSYSSVIPSSTASQLAGQLSAALAGHEGLVLNTNATLPAAAPLIVTHSYTLMALTSTASGYVLTLRNPWGIDGAGNDGDPNDGLVQITMSEFQSDFWISSVTGYLSSPATVTKTWTGLVSTDWNNPGNWNLLGVPGAADYTVTSGVVNAAGGFETARLAINSGTVTVPASGSPAASIGQTTPGVEPATSEVSTLTIAGGIAPTAALDLTNNALILQNGGAAGRDMIEEDIAYARDGGAWDRDGITSSVAKATYAADGFDSLTLGVALNSDLPTPYTSFGGLPVGPSDVLVRFTYGGDANLDGVINGEDYFAIDRGFLNQWTGWSNGDFNHDGVVNGQDYFIIDSMFLSQSGRGAASEVVAHEEMFGASYLAEFSSAQLEAAGLAPPVAASNDSTGIVQGSSATIPSQTISAAPARISRAPGVMLAPSLPVIARSPERFAFRRWEHNAPAPRIVLIDTAAAGGTLIRG